MWRRAPTLLASLPTSHWGPPHPGGGGFWTTRARNATPATPAPTRNGRRPKTWTYGSTGSHREGARRGGQHPMAAYFAMSPSRGGTPHHGRRHLRPSGGTARTTHHHGPPRPVALRGQPAHGAYGYLQPGQNERATLAMAPTGGPAHLYTHAKAQHPGHPWLPRATRDTPRATGDQGPKRSRSPPGRRHAITPRGGFPLRHVQKPPPTIRPAERPWQPSHSRGAGRHATAASGDKERWLLSAPRPHTASRSTASRLPRGYGQRPWRSTQPQRPTDIICHRSPTPVGEALHRAGAHHSHHFHAGRARATGSAPHRPPPGSRRCVQLVCRLLPRVGGRPAAGGPARRGHAIKGTRGRPTARTGGGERGPSKPPPRKQGATTPASDTGTGHPTNWAHTPRGSPSIPQRSQTAGAQWTRRDNGGTTRAARERTKK